jgi:hypothetical protein
MRALWRHRLAPLVVAAAFLSAGMSAHLAAAAPAHPSAAVFRDCPAGTNWDHIAQTCH